MSLKAVHRAFAARAESPIDMTPTEQAALDATHADGDVERIKSARLSEFDSAIAADANLQLFRTMSKAEFDAWWTANVTNAAQAIAVLKKLCWLVIRRWLQ